MLYFTILWALFAGIGDPFLALTVKKPKENQCFWLRTLKNLRKTFVFAFPRASGDPGGTIGPTTRTVQYCTVLYSAVQYCTVLLRCCTVLYSTVQYCNSTENNLKLKIFQKIDVLRFDPMDI